jgi:hypothetical protein
LTSPHIEPHQTATYVEPHQAATYIEPQETSQHTSQVFQHWTPFDPQENSFHYSQQIPVHQPHQFDLNPDSILALEKDLTVFHLHFPQFST